MSLSAIDKEGSDEIEDNDLAVLDRWCCVVYRDNVRRAMSGAGLSSLQAGREIGWIVLFASKARARLFPLSAGAIVSRLFSQCRKWDGKYRR